MKIKNGLYSHVLDTEGEGRTIEAATAKNTFFILLLVLLLVLLLRFLLSVCSRVR